jgi:hypothetical protein
MASTRRRWLSDGGIYASLLALRKSSLVTELVALLQKLLKCVSCNLSRNYAQLRASCLAAWYRPCFRRIRPTRSGGSFLAEEKTQVRIQLAKSRVAVCCTMLLLLLVVTAKADNIAFMGTVSGEFGTIDLNTGVFTLLGNSGVTLAGMAVANATLYGSSYHTSTGILYSINPTNGSLATIGTSSLDIDDFGSTTSGLYAVGVDGNLYSIHASTGAPTLIGSTGVGFGSWRSLSTNSSTLYFADGTNLCTLNTSTGAATLIGNMGGPETRWGRCLWRAVSCIGARTHQVCSWTRSTQPQDWPQPALALAGRRVLFLHSRPTRYLPPYRSPAAWCCSVRRAWTGESGLVAGSSYSRFVCCGRSRGIPPRLVAGRRQGDDQCRTPPSVATSPT